MKTNLILFIDVVSVGWWKDYLLAPLQSRKEVWPNSKICYAIKFEHGKRSYQYTFLVCFSTGLIKKSWTAYLSILTIIQKTPKFGCHQIFSCLLTAVYVCLALAKLRKNTIWLNAMMCLTPFDIFWKLKAKWSSSKTKTFGVRGIAHAHKL